MDKRELEAIQRKALKGKSGVYAIFNEQAGKIYIGSAVDIWVRWNKHKNDLRNNKHHCHHLQRSWNKYGEREFSFVIVEFCDADIRLEREQYYLDIYKDKWDLVYNEARSAIAPNVIGELNPMYGKHHTEETKKKISESRKGFKHSEESKIKMSKSRSGENNHNYGKHLSDETRKKISESQKGEKSHNYGKHFSEEHKDKIRQAVTGKNNGMYGCTGELNPFAKRLYMYDENYILIKEFGACVEGARWLINNDYSKSSLESTRKLITRAMKNNKPYKGFIFSYEPIKKSA